MAERQYSSQAGLIDEARSLYEKGQKAHSLGNLEEAKRCLLEASGKIFLAAERSRGVLKETRIRLAQELLAEAQSLEKKPVPKGKTSRTVPLAAGEEQGFSDSLVMQRPSVRFADVAGLKEVKEQIRMKLLYPFTHPELAEQYGIQPGGGILLYGPPGTGKTMIARAVAGEIDAAFFSVKPSAIMSQWVGKAEQNLANLFAEAETYPLSVLFLDEMEALSPKRRNSGSTVMQRLVPQLLAELDGFEKRRNPLLIIGATNEPWSIDAAMLRPGRLDRLIYVPPPDEAARLRILELNMKIIPLEKDWNLFEIANITQGFSGADMASLAHRVR